MRRCADEKAPGLDGLQPGLAAGDPILVLERFDHRLAARQPGPKRLQIRSGRATRIAWVAVADPHVVVQWDNGAIRMRLTGVQLPPQRKAAP